jgi:hypothetical protein
MRTVLVVVGAAVAAYGGWLLWNLRRETLPDVALWWAGGVVLHDFVLVPIVLGAGVLLARFLPDALRAPAAVGAVVLGTVTVMAVPVLGRFGARPDIPSLLDRNYLAGWLLIAGLVVAGVVLGALWRRRRTGLGRTGRVG